MSVEINPPFQVFTDVDGEPLEDGFIHIGAVNQNPQAVPVAVYWDSALTIPAAQPIRTLGGYPSRSGTPSRMYVSESEYSISVSNKNGTLIFSDLNNLAGQIGQAVFAVDSIVTLLSARQDSRYSVDVRGFHPGSDIGGGVFYWDGARAKSAHNGGTIISPTVPWGGTFLTLSAFLAGTGETNPGGVGCWVRIYEHDIHVSWFGSVVNDAAKDNKDVLEAVKLAVIAKSAPNMPKYVLPDGELYYSVSPNFGEVNGFQIEGPGADGCVLHYTGFARAVNFDPSAYDVSFRYGCSATGFLINAGPSAAASLYLENIADGYFREVFAINGAAACVHFDLRLAVLCNFDTCGVTINRWAISSVHAESWRLAVSPSKGQATTACTFTNCIGEGATLAGWRLLQCTACVWDGGTGESNAGRGVLIAAACRVNTFKGFSLEANVTEDVRDDGQLTTWIGGYAVSTSGFGIGNTSIGVSVKGMFTNSVNVISGAKGVVLENLDYNHLGTGTFTDNGTDTVVVNLRDRTSGLYVYPKKARASITVGASPFTYTNSTGRYQQVIISGGTVTQILYKRGVDTVLSGQTSGTIVVAPGDELVVSHGGAPAMSRIPLGNLAV